MDTVSTLFSISDPAGTPASIRVIFTYVSGPSASVGQAWTLTMKSNAPTPGSFTVRPLDPLNAGNAYTPSPTTNMPEGIYTVVAEYTRPASAGSTILRSTTRSNVLIDTVTQAPVLRSSAPVTINTTTDVVTDTGRGLPGNAAVYVSGTNLSASTAYYVYLIDADSYKLATTPGGSTYADLTTAGIPYVVSSAYVRRPSTSVAIDTATDVITKVGHGLAANTQVYVFGTNLSETTTYYVFVLDVDSYKLATTSGGSTYADFTTATSPRINTSFITLNSGSAHSSVVHVNYTLSEAYLTNTAHLIFTGPVTADLLLADNLLNSRFAFSTAAISAPGFVQSSTQSALPDGIYSVTLSYQDRFGHTAATAVATSVVIQTSTPAPSFTGLTSSSRITDGSTIAYTLPSQPLAGSAVLTFDNGTTQVPLVLPNTTGATTFTYSRATHGTAIPSGTYSVTVAYQDFLGNPLATSAVVTGVTVDLETQTPAFTALTSSAKIIDAGTIAYTLPEAPLAGSVQLVFNNGPTDTILSLGDSLSDTFTYSRATHGATIPTGTYTVTLRYRDALNNPVASVAVSGVTVDILTQNPVFTALTNSGSIREGGAVAYTLPEMPQANSVELVFNNGTTDTVVQLPDTLSGSFTYDRSTLGSTIPDGSYTVTLRYLDASGNPVASTAVTGITVDSVTQAPSFTALTNGGAISHGSVIAYTLPETPLTGSVVLVFNNGTTDTVVTLGDLASASFTFNRALYSATIPTGTYSVSLRYRDALGNPLASTTATGIAVTAPPLVATEDTDGDGLNDVAEFTLATLGFDWQVSQTSLVNAFLTDKVLFTQSHIDTSRVSGRGDVTSAPGSYNLFTSAENDASRTAGRADVTNSPNTYSLYTSAQLQTQVDASRLLGRGDVTSAPGTYSLFTSAQNDASRTAGRTDVTSDPAAYSLYTLTGLQNLYVATPLLVKNTTTGKWTLTMAVQQSTNLVDFTPFPITAPATTINSSGDVEFEFTAPDSNAFYRVQAR